MCTALPARFVLALGASVVYTAVSETYTDAVRKVKYWKADNDGYVLYDPFSELVNWSTAQCLSLYRPGQERSRIPFPANFLPFRGRAW